MRHLSSLQYQILFHQEFNFVCVVKYHGANYNGIREFRNVITNGKVFSVPKHSVREACKDHVGKA